MTSYTYGIVDEDWDFKEYAKRCMDAFCFETRDGGNAVFPLKPDDSYEHNKIKRLKKELVELLATDEADYIAEQNKKNEEYFQSSAKEHAGYAEGTQKMEKVLDELIRWEIPTEEHKRFKEFMTQQLVDSLKYRKSPPPSRTEYMYVQPLAEAIQELKDDIEKAKAEILKIKERTDEHNAWRKPLFEEFCGA